jgi:hypothetical protein
VVVVVVEPITTQVGPLQEAVGAISQVVLAAAQPALTTQRMVKMELWPVAVAGAVPPSKAAVPQVDLAALAAQVLFTFTTKGKEDNGAFRRDR